MMLIFWTVIVLTVVLFLALLVSGIWMILSDIFSFLGRR